MRREHKTIPPRFEPGLLDQQVTLGKLFTTSLRPSVLTDCEPRDRWEEGAGQGLGNENTRGEMVTC